MRRALRRWRWPLRVLAVVGVLAVVPLCALLRGAGVRVTSVGRGTGPLLAGAGEGTIVVPFPVAAVGYGTVRPDLERSAVPLKARALVLASGEERVGLLTLDLLLVDDALVAMVRRSAAGLRLSTVWVMASHAHSSLGAYASNPVVQVAGTGHFRPSVRERVVAAATQALASAAGHLEPVEAFAGESVLTSVTVSRDEFPEVDARLTRLVLRGSNGPVGQLVVFAAHPTLVERPPPALDPDWPGRLAMAQQALGQGVTLVVQGSGGNATATRPPEGKGAVEAMLGVLDRGLETVPLHPLGPGLGHASVEVTLPGPDASRLVPRPLATLVDNVVLCPWAPRRAEVAMLGVGNARFLALPAEATAASGGVLEGAAGGARLVSPVNGYLGYVEPADRVLAGRGESPRQLFAPALLEALRTGTEAAARAAAAP